MTDTTVTRGFEFRTNGKDTDVMVLKASGMQAMLMSMMGMAAFLVVTRNEELANILSDTAGFDERQDVADIGDKMLTAFADDGTLALMGLLEGVQSDNYDQLVAEVEREAAEAKEQADEEVPAAPAIVEVESDDEDEFEDIEDEDDDWDDYEDDDDWEDDEDDYEDD